MFRRLPASAALVAIVVTLTPVAAGQNQASNPANPQNPPTLNGAISGLVVDGSTGNALTGVIVGLVAMPGTPLPPGYQARQISDAKGRFAFTNLPNDGLFQITAAKYGYLDGGFGRDSAPTDPLRPVVIANGSWIANLRVSIWTPGVISGTVRDESGEPVVGVVVRALAKLRIAGRDQLAAGPLVVTDDHGRYRIPGLLPGRYVIQVPSVQMSAPGGTKLNAATTNVPEGAIDVDDTVRLVIGRYPLPPPSVNGRAMTYGVAFHPNTSAPGQATAIDVHFGDDRPGIDVSLTPVPAVRISGLVEGPPEALVGLTLRLLPAGMEELGLGSEVATALVGENGSFVFVNVPAGSYVLDAPMTFNEYSMASGPSTSGGFVGSRGVSLPGLPPRSGWSRSSQGINDVPGVNLSATDFRGVYGDKVANFTARVPLTVAANDMSGLVVRMRPGTTMRGKLTVEADPSKPAVTRPPFLAIFLDPAGGQASLGQPRAAVAQGANPDFEIPGVQAGEYFLRAQAGTGWLVKSIQWRGRDYTTTPFDAGGADDFSGVALTVTNAVPTLTGIVRAPDGSAPQPGLVVAFPAQPELRTNMGLWSPRVATAPIRSDGTFRLTDVPAGDYLVAAIDRSRMSTWRNPDLLSAIERQASRVTLTWGQTISRDLTMTVIR